MDRRDFLKTAGAGALALSLPGSAFSWLSGLGTEEIEAKIKDILPKMTLDEKTTIMAGQVRKMLGNLLIGKAGDHGYTGYTVGVPRLGVPRIQCLDGPRGVGFNYKSTCFPVSMCRGASFDPALEERVGATMGYEIRAYGGNMLLAPCINLLWHPRWGRAQETYGEDPAQIGPMGAGFVRGLQRHVMACAKHFAVNNTENNRTSVNAQADERTLRETFLPHFKACVDAGAASIMSSYNDVNGYLAAHNQHLLRDILKGDWNFDGFVVSDWGAAVEDTVAAALGGLDLEMPGPAHFGPKLARAVRAGKVPESMVDEAVTRLLRQLFRFVKDNFTAGYDRAKIAGAEHAAVAREAAEKGMVLLKNQDGLLPLDPAKIQKLLVCGALADAPNLGDHGSSRVTPPYTTSPLQGLRKRLGLDKIAYEQDPARAATAAAGADAALVFVGVDYEGEGNDRKGLGLSAADEALLRKVAAANPRAAAVVFAGAAVTMDWIDRTAAVVMAWYPGMEGGNAIARLLFGDVNPSGKLPMVFPKSDSQLYPFENKGKEATFAGWHGYRYFDDRKLETLFPFGFGLSYTTFKYGNLKLAAAEVGPDGALTATVDIANTGSRAGEEVAQLYVAAPGREVARPPKELKAFAKVALAPGETRTVELKVKAADLAYWDIAGNGWKLEPGEYRALVGPSSRSEDLLEAGFKV